MIPKIIDLVDDNRAEALSLYVPTTSAHKRLFLYLNPYWI
jgi:hypothetical protein